MEIKHIYTATGMHYLVIDGVRGETALYESVASHPAGYIALSPYYTGDGNGRVMRVDLLDVPDTQDHLTEFDPNRKVREWTWYRLWKKQDRKEQNRYELAQGDLF